MRPRISIRGCVRPSVSPSVGRSVPCFFQTENMNLFHVRMIIFDKKILYIKFLGRIPVRGCVSRSVGPLCFSNIEKKQKMNKKFNISMKNEGGRIVWLCCMGD